MQNLDDSHLKESLVFSIDEFWIANEPDVNSPFADLSDFLERKSEFNTWKRSESFEPNLIPNSNGSKTRVPLHKDFGLILADMSVWKNAKDLTVEGWQLEEYTDSDFKKILRPHRGAASVGLSNELDFASLPTNLSKHAIFQTKVVGGRKVVGHDNRLKVGHVWNALCHPTDRFNKFDKGKVLFSPSWPVFMAACDAVAKNCGRQPYDIDLRTSETLSSNLLEIWISECKSRLASWESVSYTHLTLPTKA